MTASIIKSFEKTATDAGSFMGRFAKSTLNAFGGATPPKPPPPPKAPPPVAGTGGQTMNQRMGNPFG